MDEHRNFPDYCGDFHQSAALAFELRNYHARRGRTVEVLVVKERHNNIELYVIRSNITITNPPVGPLDKDDFKPKVKR